MKYKLYVSGYIEETQQLLISFSSDETANEAADYQALAFDIVPYGDISAQQIIDNIAKTAPTICNDMVIQETYTDNSEKANSLKNLIGKEFVYNDSTLVESYHRKKENEEESESL
jgi:hypothetical protein